MKALLPLVLLWCSWHTASPSATCPVCASDEICNVNTSSCDCDLAQYTESADLTLEINCNPESMAITLSRCQLEKDLFNPSALHYADPTCGGVRGIADDKAVIIASTEATNGTCGNVQTGNETHITISNTLTIPAQAEGSSQTVGVSCTYNSSSGESSNRTVLMPLFITTWSNEVEGFGNFSAQMALYWDALLSVPVNSMDVLYVGDNVFLGVTVPELDENQFSVLVKSLFAAPNTTSALRFDLITEGCPNSSGVNLLVKQNGHTNLASFEMSIFKITGHDSFILFADLFLCESSCSLTCLESGI